jgi:hypothetical protein
MTSVPVFLLSEFTQTIRAGYPTHVFDCYVAMVLSGDSVEESELLSSPNN